MARIGFVINPIAGMGGRVGLKGTDDVATDAARLGAIPIANERSSQALRELKGLLDHDAFAPAIAWLTVSGDMGEQALRGAGFEIADVVHEAPDPPSAADTKAAVNRFIALGVDLILFCGGDGTARDICGVTGKATPVLGIPSGVKMYSGVFGITPQKTAEILFRFLKGGIGLAEVEILDLDEERYRRGEWAVRLHMSASTPFEPSYVQAAKALLSGQDDAAAKEDIGAHLSEEIETNPDTLYLLGPGSTVEAVARAIGIDKTLLGIDALIDGRLAGKDLNERQLLELLGRHPRRKLVLSPIGAQGFVLGRGNQQLSPAVIRAIGVGNIIVVATPAKLMRTPVLRFDTGDAALDAELICVKYWPVVIGYRRTRLVKTAG
jgi:predicted polyphosphate/ATP-dependent NAD kinase